jgi:hypothetical protein
MQSYNNQGISEVLGFILILLMVTGVIAAINFWAIPYIDEKKATAHQESALLQFNAISEIVNSLINQGPGSSNSITLDLNKGDLFIEEKGERFVIYYPLFDYGSDIEDAFDFDVFDFEETNFKITINNADFDNKALDFFIEDIVSRDFTTISIGIDKNIEFTIIQWAAPPSLTNNISIHITDSSNPLDIKEYGRIWVFDVGCLDFNIATSSNSRSIRFENGGIISKSDSKNGYMYTLPINWVNNLLDGSKICSFRIIKLQSDESLGVNSVGFTGSINVIFHLSNLKSMTFSDSLYITGDLRSSQIRLKIIGDEAATAAWKIYFKNKLNFSENTLDNYLYISKVEKFSLSLFIIRLGMEVIYAKATE